MSRHFDKAEGLSENHDPATHEFVFNQTMFRIKDPKRTLHFYSEVMGMTLIKRFDFPAMEFRYRAYRSMTVWSAGSGRIM